MSNNTFIKEIDNMIQKHKQILQEMLSSMDYSIDIAEIMEKQKEKQKVLY